MNKLTGLLITIVALLWLLPASLQAYSRYSPRNWGYSSYSYSYYSYYSYSYYRSSVSSWTLAGHDLNGVSLNGDWIEGATVVSVDFDSAQIKGRTVHGARLDGDKFVGTIFRGKRNKAFRVAGKRFIGATFEGNLDTGATIALRIDDAYRGSDRETRHIRYYDVSYHTEDGWLPLCGEDELGYPVPAIALEGAWDYSEGTDTGGSRIDDAGVFTFGCTGHVLAKCAEMGYAPWRFTLSCEGWRDCKWVSLKAHHQACTRMMRADYCGNGISHTEDGVLINAYDGLYARSDILDWEFEAEWDEDGAVCASTTRLEETFPTCFRWLGDDTCGDVSHFNEGTLIFSEIEP